MTQSSTSSSYKDLRESHFHEWLDNQQGELPIVARRGLLRDWCRMAFFAAYDRGYDRGAKNALYCMHDFVQRNLSL